MGLGLKATDGGSTKLFTVVAHKSQCLVVYLGFGLVLGLCVWVWVKGWVRVGFGFGDLVGLGPGWGRCFLRAGYQSVVEEIHI